MDPYDYDAAVIRAAETLCDKWRAFQEGDANEDPDSYAVALEKAVEVRRQANKPKATAAPSITQAEADRMRGDKIREELYGVKYATPTIEADKLKAGTMQRPITVGTQVRLTGVVVNSTEKDCWVTVNGADVGQEGILIFDAPFEALEVIRQPFKRGEVVWQGTTELSVLADEEANTVLLVEPMAGAVAFGADAHLFERRP